MKENTFHVNVSTPRLLVAFALCSGGILLSIFSVAATPPVPITHIDNNSPLGPANLRSPSTRNANDLPPALSLPLGNRLPLNLQGDRSITGNEPFALPAASQSASPEGVPVVPGLPSNWSIVSSPNSIATETLNGLLGVTCVTTSDCWVVGYYYAGSAYQTLIGHWDGITWTVVRSPNSSTAQDNLLLGVTCTSASECWAVGSHAADGAWHTLVEHWNGSTWAIFSSPNTSQTKNNNLLGVTCTSASDCWAVGAYAADSAYQSLIQHWDGTSWVIVSSPNTNATANNALSAVTCASASECWSVGSYDSARIPQSLIEHWDGTAWAVVSSPNASTTMKNALSGVTCVSASDCWAVGYSNAGVDTTSLVAQSLTEHWNGSSWTIVPSLNLPEQSNILFSVTCASASQCWAVGYSNSVSAFQTLIESWDGVAWTIVPSPNTSPAQKNILSWAMCMPTSQCWAVGFYNNGNTFQNMIEHWDGTSWTVANSPNSARSTNALNDVTCVSESDCWAVGYYVDITSKQTLIAHWDGVSWSVVSSPNMSTAQENQLSSVACRSPSACWAVGDYFNGVAYQTLLEQWDGASWTLASAPNTSMTQSNFLLGVTYVTTGEYWAVGFYYDSSGTARTLIEQWNGTSWSIFSSPNIDTTVENSVPIQLSNTLSAVTCTSAFDCWAVGQYYDGSGYRTLIEQWDGASWAVVSSPNTSSGAAEYNYLTSITCASASECWAVGYYLDTAWHTLIEHWDGTAWVIVSSPNTSDTRYNFLFDVTCVSVSECWAVGNYSTGNAYQTLIEHWDGVAWGIVNSPNVSVAQDNILLAVTCPATSECWAIGYGIDGVAFQTLAAHYTATPPIPTSVVSRKTHGTAGDFDIDLLIGTSRIECRSGGATGDHQVVITFAAPVTLSSANAAPGAGATGSVSRAPIVSGNQVTVNLTNVSNAQTLVINLLGVSDGTNNGDISIPMAVLAGDTTKDRTVNSADIAQTKSQSGQAVTSSNFREDVTVDGTLNSSDIALVKSKSGTALP